MAWNTHKKALAIKAIGTVESDLKYDSVYYVDPITIGIAQWFGTRASSLLRKMTGISQWSGVAESLKKSLNNHPDSESSYWSSRYLTRAEGESLRPLLLSAEGKRIQNKQFIADLDDYYQVAKRLGLDPESNTDTFIFWCIIYHQYPSAARKFLSGGGPYTIAKLYAQCANHSWLSKYMTRYKKARTIIESNDASGIPDMTGTNDDGTPDNPPDGGDSGGDDTQSPSNTIKYCRIIGEEVWVYSGQNKIIRCHRISEDVYIPKTGVGATDNGGNNTPVPEDPSNPTPGTPNELQAKVIKWMVDRIGKLKYSQGAGRMNSDSSGVGDCSSTVAQAYKTIGINIGTWTGDQENRGTKIWDSLEKGAKPDPSIIHPGDLIYYWWKGTGGHSDHVNMFESGDNVLDHGGRPYMGPVRKSLRAKLKEGRRVRVVRWIK